MRVSEEEEGKGVTFSMGKMSVVGGMRVMRGMREMREKRGEIVMKIVMRGRVGVMRGGDERACMSGRMDHSPCHLVHRR